MAGIGLSSSKTWWVFLIPIVAKKLSKSYELTFAEPFLSITLIIHPISSGSAYYPLI